MLKQTVKMNCKVFLALEVFGMHASNQLKDTQTDRPPLFYWKLACIMHPHTPQTMHHAWAHRTYHASYQCATQRTPAGVAKRCPLMVDEDDDVLCMRIIYEEIPAIPPIRSVRAHAGGRTIHPSIHQSGDHRRRRRVRSRPKGPKSCKRPIKNVLPPPVAWATTSSIS